MTFQHFNRRLHLYLGLVLVPWYLMYGVSSIPFAHNQYFEQRDRAKGIPLWTTRIDQKYSVDVPAEGDLRETGARIMKDLGLEGSFGAYRQSPTQLNVYIYNFRHSTQVKYFLDQQRVTVEDRRFRFEHFLTGMHARGGFEQESLLVNAWSAVVDVVCFGMLLWILTGLYMWWSLPGLRTWGWLAFLGGVGSYAMFMMKL
jgi:hypothetical protein